MMVLEYVYRDASNFKSRGYLLLDADPKGVAVDEVAGWTRSEELFVAEQVGIPPLYEPLWQLVGGPTRDDHAFHEFVELRDATEEEVRELPVWGTLEQLVQAFEAVTGWDVTLSPNCATSL